MGGLTMDCKETRYDLRESDPKGSAEDQRCTKLLFQLNHTMPFEEEYNHILAELFGKNLGEGSSIAPPLNGACVSSIKIGKNVFINSNLLAMARGGITIENHVIGALISIQPIFLFGLYCMVASSAKSRVFCSQVHP